MATNNADWMPVFGQPPVPSSFHPWNQTIVAPALPLLGSAGQTAGATVYLTQAGTVVASFLGTSLSAPYSAYPVGLPANLPAVPNQGYPAVGALLPSGVDTSIYVPFTIPPTNVSGSGSGIGVNLSSSMTVRMDLCTDPNPKNADLKGTQAYFGISTGVLTQGTSTVDDADLSGENRVLTPPLSTVAGGFTQFSALAPSSLVPGGPSLLRITRRGSSLFDSHKGRLLLIGVQITLS